MVSEIAIERYNVSSLSVLGQSEMDIEEFQGRFTMIKQIGKGGYASVYKYQEKLTSKNFAVKILFIQDHEIFEKSKKEVIIM